MSPPPIQNSLIFLWSIQLHFTIILVEFISAAVILVLALIFTHVKVSLKLWYYTSFSSVVPDFYGIKNCVFENWYLKNF
jgi:hypothetical protein